MPQKTVNPTILRCLKLHVPITTREISTITGLQLKTVQLNIAIAIKTKVAKNVGTHKHSRYVLNEDTGPIPMPYKPIPVEQYVATKSTCARIGAEDFLKCRSIENGKPVERKRPVIISSQQINLNFRSW